MEYIPGQHRKEMAEWMLDKGKDYVRIHSDYCTPGISGGWVDNNLDELDLEIIHGFNSMMRQYEAPLENIARIWDEIEKRRDHHGGH